MSLVLAVTLVMSVFGGLTAFAADAASIPEGYTVVEAVADGNDAYGWKIDDETTLYVYYPGNTKVFTKDDYTSRPWQDSAEKITKVVIDGTPTEIGDYTFYQMSNLAEVTFAGTETIINPCAFADTAISGVFTIPAHINILHGQAFMNCPINILIFDGDESSKTLYLRKGLQYLGNLTNIIIKRAIGFSEPVNERTLNKICGTYASGTYGMTNPARINVIAAKSSYFNSFKTITAYTGKYDTASNDAKKKEHSVAPALFGECDVFDATEGVRIGKFTDNVWYLLYDENTDSTLTDYTVEFVTDGTEVGTTMTKYGYSLSNNQYTIKNEQLAKFAAEIKKMVFGFGFTQLQSCFGTNKGINDLYDKGKHTRYENLREVVFPAQFARIWDYAFCNIRTLKKVNFEDTAIRTIDKKAFAYCPLETVKLPATISTIGEMAFVGNTALETLYLPSSASLNIAKGAFAREFNQPGFDNKTLKVIADGPQFAVGTNVVASAFDNDSNIAKVDKAWRNTLVIYDSADNWTNTNNLGLGNRVSAVADKYYEMHDKDNDGKISLWMFNYAEVQPYSMFVATYDGSTLGTVEMLANDELAIGTLLDEDFDVSSKIGNKPAKVFLWNGFLNISPLHSAVEKNIE